MDKKIKLSVMNTYSGIAKGEKAGCCGDRRAEVRARGEDRLRRKGACGAAGGRGAGGGLREPVALASLKEGEVVVDLGSGAGIDVFLAAGRVGPSGRVNTGHLLGRCLISD